MPALHAKPQWIALLAFVLPFLVFAQYHPSSVENIHPDFVNTPWVNLTGGYIRIPYNYNAALTQKILSQLPYTPTGNISSFRFRPRPDVDWNLATRDIPYVGMQEPLLAAEHLSQYSQPGVVRRDEVPPQPGLVPTTPLAPPGPFDAMILATENVVSDTYDRCAMDKAVWETAADQLRTADNFFLHSDDWLTMNGRRFDVQGAAKILLDDAAVECVGAARAAADAYLHSLPGQRQKRRLAKRQVSSQSSADYVAKKLDAMAEEMVNQMFPAMTPVNGKIAELLVYKGAQASAIYEAKQRMALDRIKVLEQKRANGTYTIQDDTLFDQTQAYRNEAAYELTNEFIRISAEESSSFESPIARVFAAEFQVSHATQAGNPPATPQLHRRADLPAGLPPAGLSADGLPPADLPLAAAPAAGAPPMGVPAAGAPPVAAPPAGAAPAVVPPAGPQVGSAVSMMGDIIEDSGLSQNARNARAAGELAADARASVDHGLVARMRSRFADVPPMRNAVPPRPYVAPLYTEDLPRTNAREKAYWNEMRGKIRNDLTAEQKAMLREKHVRGKSTVPRPVSDTPPLNENSDPVQPPVNENVPVNNDIPGTSNSVPESQAARDARMKTAIDETGQREAAEIRNSGKSPAQIQQDLQSLESDTRQSGQAVTEQSARQAAMRGQVANGVGEAGPSEPRPRPRPQRSFQELSTQYRKDRAAISQSHEVARAARGKARTVEAEVAHEQIQWDAGQRLEARLAEDVRAAEARGENPVQLHRQLGEARDWLSEHRVDRIASGADVAAAEEAVSSADESVVEATQRARQTSEELVQTAKTPEDVAGAHEEFIEAFRGAAEEQERLTEFIQEHNVGPREDWHEIRSRVDSVVGESAGDEAGQIARAEKVEELGQQVQANEQQAEKVLADIEAVKDMATEDLNAIVDANAMSNAKIDELGRKTEAAISEAQEQLRSGTFSAADQAAIEAAVAEDEATLSQTAEVQKSMLANQAKLAENAGQLPQDYRVLADTAASQQAEIERLEQSLASRDATIEKARARKAFYKGSAQGSEARAQAAKAALDDQQNRALQLKSNLEQAQGAAADATAREQAMREDIAKTSQQLEELKTEHGEKVERQKRLYRNHLEQMEKRLGETTARHEADRNAAEAARNELEGTRRELASAQEAYEASKASHAEDTIRLQDEKALLNDELLQVREQLERSRLRREASVGSIRQQGVVLEALSESDMADGVVAIEAPRSRLLMDVRLSNHIPEYTGLVDSAPPSVPGSPILLENGSPNAVEGDPLPANPENAPPITDDMPINPETGLSEGVEPGRAEPLPGSPSAPEYIAIGEPGNPAELPADWPAEIPNPELAPAVPPARPPPAIPATDDLGQVLDQVQTDLQDLRREAEATVDYARRNNLPGVVESAQTTLRKINAQAEAAQTLATEVAAGTGAESAAGGATEAALGTNVAAAEAQYRGMVEVLPEGFDETMTSALWNPARVAFRSNEAAAEIARMEALDRQVNERLALEVLSPGDQAALVAQSSEIQQGLADLRATEAASQAAGAAADASMLDTVGQLARLERFCVNRISELQQLMKLKAAGTGFRAGLWESISALEAAGAGSAGADAKLAEELMAKKSLFQDLIKGSNKKYGSIEKEVSAALKAADKAEKASAEVVEATSRYRSTIEALTGVASRASQAVEASPRAAWSVAEGMRLVRSGFGVAGRVIKASTLAKVNSVVKTGKYTVNFAKEAYSAIRTGTVVPRIVEAAVDARRLIRAGGAVRALWSIEIAYFTTGEVAYSETVVIPIILACIEAIGKSKST